MPHPDDDELVLLALDEPPTDPAVTEHLATCATCRDELDAIRRVVGLGRETASVPDPLPAASPDIWRAIAAETGVRDRVESDEDTESVAAWPGTTGPAGPAAPPPAANPLDQAPSSAVLPAPSEEPVTSFAEPPVSLAERRAAWSWRDRRFLAATAAVVLILALVGIGAVTREVDEDRSGTRVVASAPLSAVDNSGAESTGEARVLAESSGRVLHLHVTGLPRRDGFYEAWLFDPDSGAMVSVGVLGEGSDALFPLPSTMDLDRFRVVDVSAEHYDGVQEHSKISVVRGTLRD